MRDDFTEKTKTILAQRVSYLCSNPSCQRPTVAANSEADKVTNIGVAAHIAAASQGGARYDASLSSEERKSISNGIWLCWNCSKFIDDDETKYPVSRLQEWKKDAEQRATERIANPSPALKASGLFKSGITKSLLAELKKQKNVIDSYIDYYDANKDRMDELSTHTPSNKPMIDMQHNIKADLSFWNNIKLAVHTEFSVDDSKEINGIFDLLYQFSESGYVLLEPIEALSRKAHEWIEKLTEIENLRA